MKEFATQLARKFASLPGVDAHMLLRQKCDDLAGSRAATSKSGKNKAAKNRK
ncbi:unnamed protein product, partial [Amoebophrya sp. A25]|eukprot:GSA25T00016247001.1